MIVVPTLEKLSKHCQNIGRTKTNLVTSNNLYFLYILNYDVHIDFPSSTVMKVSKEFFLSDDYCSYSNRR